MPLPSSGQISIKDIYNEVTGTSGVPSSTHVTAGLTEVSNLVTSVLYGYGGITSAAADPGNVVAANPQALSEFYEVDQEGA